MDGAGTVPALLPKDYILTGEVHGQIASEIKYPCPNADWFLQAQIPEEGRERSGA